MMFFVSFELDVLVLANMVDFSNNTRDEHFLGDEADEEGAYHDEKFLETTKVTQEGQDICDFAVVRVVEFVCTKIDAYKVAIRVDIVIFIGFDI